MFTEPLCSSGHSSGFQVCGGDTLRQVGDFISLLLFFQSKESRLKKLKEKCKLRAKTSLSILWLLTLCLRIGTWSMFLGA
jgi:hypothetical protein